MLKLDENQKMQCNGFRFLRRNFLKFFLSRDTQNTKYLNCISPRHGLSIGLCPQNCLNNYRLVPRLCLVAKNGTFYSFHCRASTTFLHSVEFRVPVRRRLHSLSSIAPNKKNTQQICHQICHERIQRIETQCICSVQETT